jgi:hypothetical protein
MIAVRSHFEPASGLVESGMADVTMPSSAAEGQLAYAKALETRGWDVNLSYFDGTTPDLPPRRFHQCHVEARKAGRLLRLALEEDGSSSKGSLYWADGPANSIIGGSPGNC